MPTWSSRIKELREAGLTLAQIGERTGLAPSSVSDIEQGRSESPRGDAAILLHELHKELCVPKTKRAQLSA